MNYLKRDNSVIGCISNTSALHSTAPAEPQGFHGRAYRNSKTSSNSTTSSNSRTSSNFRTPELQNSRTSSNSRTSPNFRTPELQNSRTSLYTLIEILMVIVIMSLLMAAGMPAFVDMMKGQGVESSACNLGQILKLARSHAINNREYVAVVIPNANLNKYNFRSYRVCLINKDKSFKRWLQSENWIFTSVGVAVVDINNSSTPYTSGTTLTPAYNDADDITAVNCTDIIKPDGTNYGTQNLKGIIFKPTGKAIQGSLIYIGEATGSGTDLIATSASDGNVSIKIDQFTGRVTFVD